MYFFNRVAINPRFNVGLHDLAGISKLAKKIRFGINFPNFFMLGDGND